MFSSAWRDKNGNEKKGLKVKDLQKSCSLDGSMSRKLSAKNEHNNESMFDYGKESVNNG